VPIILVAIALLLFLVVITLTLPLSVIQRYRAGTSRRLARGWLAATNVVSLAISVLIFLGTAAIGSAWIAHAFVYSVLGLAVGALLGLLGIRLTRWEATPHTLHYTPNRWLVLAITVAIAARICFGFWRAWQAWRFTPDEQSWLAASGLAGSMAAGAVVLGYYFTYWAGVWTRAKQHRPMR
jgi:hypothetical protein